MFRSCETKGNLKTKTTKLNQAANKFMRSRNILKRISVYSRGNGLKFKEDRR